MPDCTELSLNLPSAASWLNVSLSLSSLQNAGKLFRIRVVGGSAAYSYLSPQDSRPLHHPAVDRYKASVCRQPDACAPLPAHVHVVHAPYVHP